MASILEGSTEIPSLEMICPNKFPLSTPKIDFLGLREIPYSCTFEKSSSSVGYVDFFSWR
jgi:hypothetical protein